MRDKILKLGVIILLLGLVFNSSDFINLSYASNENSVNSNASSGNFQLKSVRFSDNNVKSRIVLDLNELPEYAMTEDNAGQNLKLSLSNTSYINDVEMPDLRGKTVKNMYLTKENNCTYLNIDLDTEVIVYKVFILKNPNRIVIDIYKDYKDIKTTSQSDGLNLTEYSYANDKGPVKVYILEVDPELYNISQALAGGSISAGRATLKDIVSSNNAVAGINASFFGYNGDLRAASRIDGKTAGATLYNRSALGIMKDGSMKIGKVSYRGSVTINNVKLSVSGVNKLREENNLILYNSNFGSNTKTNKYGLEFVIKDGKVVDIQKNNTDIPKDGVVVSVHGTSYQKFKDVKVGDTAKVEEFYDGNLSNAAEIIGAGPEILKDGTVKVSKTEGFSEDMMNEKTARSAIGIMKNGHIIMMVIDGNQQNSVGATLQETAELMKRFGAVNAMNLDGKTSSEMVINDKVINILPTGQERPIGNAIIVKKK